MLRRPQIMTFKQSKMAPRDDGNGGDDDGGHGCTEEK